MHSYALHILVIACAYSSIFLQEMHALRKAPGFLSLQINCMCMLLFLSSCKENKCYSYTYCNTKIKNWMMTVTNYYLGYNRYSIAVEGHIHVH